MNPSSGDTVTAFDSSGAPAALQFRWAKTDSADLGTGHKDTWNLFYQTDAKATGTDAAWQNVGTDFTFVNNQLLAGDSVGRANQREGR